MCNISYKNINSCLVLFLKGKAFNIYFIIRYTLAIGFLVRYALSDWGSSLLICFDRRTMQSYRAKKEYGTFRIMWYEMYK